MTWHGKILFDWQFVFLLAFSRIHVSFVQFRWMAWHQQNNGLHLTFSQSIHTRIFLCFFFSPFRLIISRAYSNCKAMFICYTDVESIAWRIMCAKAEWNGILLFIRHALNKRTNKFSLYIFGIWHGKHDFVWFGNRPSQRCFYILSMVSNIL